MTNLRAGCASHPVERLFYFHLPAPHSTPENKTYPFESFIMAGVSSGSLLQAVPDALKLSREYALLGKYDTAAVYFDGAVAAIQQYAK